MENNKMKKQAEGWQINTLPKLIDNDIKTALTHENRTWAMNFSNPENIGKVYNMDTLGFTIQNSGYFNVRCISVIDHFECRIGLALMKETFDSIRVNFDLKNLIVMPFIKPDKNPQIADEKQTSNIQESIYFDVV